MKKEIKKKKKKSKIIDVKKVAVISHILVSSIFTYR